MLRRSARASVVDGSSVATDVAEHEPVRAGEEAARLLMTSASRGSSLPRRRSELHREFCAGAAKSDRCPARKTLPAHAMPVRTSSYYATYHGHDVEHLEELLPVLRRGGNDGKRACIFLAGDSSLDNKFWFENSADALNGYEHALEPPRMKLDICYWLKLRGAAARAQRALLPQHRDRGDDAQRPVVRLRPRAGPLHPRPHRRERLPGRQRRRQRPRDGAGARAAIINIIPSCAARRSGGSSTARSRARPISTSIAAALRRGLPGCVAGTLKSRWPPGMGYFVDLFANRVQNYIVNMLAAGGRARLWRA